MRNLSLARRWPSVGVEDEALLAHAAAGRDTAAFGELYRRGEFAASSPAWSLDGRQIAFAAAPDAGKLSGGEEARQALMKRRIWVKDFKTGRTRQLTDDDRYRDEYPLWSADGSSLLFARLDDRGRASLWLDPSAGGPPSLVLDELPALPSASGDGWFGYYGHLDWAELFDWWR